MNSCSLRLPKKLYRLLHEIYKRLRNFGKNTRDRPLHENIQYFEEFLNFREVWKVIISALGQEGFRVGGVDKFSRHFNYKTLTA